MLTPVHCIALRTVRLSDSRNLLSAWSREAGRVTFAIPAGATREARRRKAVTSPLAFFEGIADIRDYRDIQTVRDIMPMPGSIAMNPSPVTGMSAFFIAEVLDLLMRKSTPDDDISDFLFDSIAAFAQMKGRDAANFHIVFLYALAHYSGIAPDTGEYVPASVFDMREGRFRRSAPLHDDHIEGNEARMMMLVARTPLNRPGHLPFTRQSRNRALDLILRYYALHLAPLTSLKSLDILRMM